MSFQRQPQTGMFQPQSPFMFPQQNLPVGFEPQFQGDLFHQQPQFGHGHGQLEQQINRLERRVNQLERDRDAMDKRIKKLEGSSSHNHNHGQGHHHGHQHYFQPRPMTYDPNGY